jgi:ubiquinone/menaquinone biosynthesis C-methylase UbiE
MVIANTERTYIPAAGRNWRLPLYDPITKLLGVDRTRRRLVAQAELTRGQRVLEVGCGTGSLLIEMGRQHPAVELVGLDPDPRALARAERKARRAGVRLRLDRGFSDAMPYEDASFDRVLSSFMYHHVPPDEKLAMFREIHRVLKPGGRLELVDFAGPERAHGFFARMLHAHHIMKDNAEAHVIALMTEAKLSNAARVGDDAFLIGSVSYYQAVRAH